MHTYSSNNIINLKYGMNHGQTACLAVVGYFVAEGRSRDYHKCRNLTKERQRTDKSNEKPKDSTAKVLRML